jgi:hypothetical protein
LFGVIESILLSVSTWFVCRPVSDKTALSAGLDARAPPP